MSRKALFFDVDGTLLINMSREIPKSAVEAIQKAREAGHLVFINSGRARCLLHEVEDSLPVDGYLCGCGTYVEIAGHVALHHVIAEHRRLELQRDILIFGLDGILEGPKGCCTQKGVSNMGEIERVKEAVYRNGALFSADWTEKAVPFDKFCVLADEGSDIEGFLEMLNPDIAAIDRGHGLYECVPAGFDKATAMQFVLDYFKIPREESYAFGDSTNDLAMIRYAGNAVIMGQHDKALEPYASFVTKDVEDGGIAYALEKLHLI
ncbi:MAG: HAD family phosphatase [Lachnospiraceae bacterium]|nr:HAD family phosphatase [Lachnospiraceae bacterium]